MTIYTGDQYLRQYQNFSNVLMYSIKENKYNGQKVILIYTNANQTFALVYTPELKEKIISEMKTISKIEKRISEKLQQIRYKDGICYHLPIENDTAKKVLKDQRKYWWKKNKGKVIGGSAVTAAIIAGIINLSGENCDLLKNINIFNKTKKSDESTDALNSEYKELGKKLYQQITSNGGLEYAEAANIDITEEFTTEIVEFINGLYPSAVKNMDSQDASLEMERIFVAVDLIFANNLNTENSNKVINVSDYVLNRRASMILEQTTKLTRNFKAISLGEPVDGNLILTDEECQKLGLDPCKPKDKEIIETEYKKFSTEYLDINCQILEYIDQTINDSNYLQLNSNIKYVINLYFQNLCNELKQDTYITKQENNMNKDYYYRYFEDDSTHRLYLPRERSDGAIEYVCSYYDEQNICHEEVYSIDTMFAMAGESITEEERDLQIDPNPNIHRKGVEKDLENTTNDLNRIILNGLTVSKDDENVVVVNENNEIISYEGKSIK